MKTEEKTKSGRRKIGGGKKEGKETRKRKVQKSVIEVGKMREEEVEKKGKRKIEEGKERRRRGGGRKEKIGKRSV